MPIMDIRRTAFELFLSLLYPSSVHRILCHECSLITYTHSVPTTNDAPRQLNVDDWISVLDQSHRWRCDKVRMVAVERLRLLPMDDVLKIAVWRKYNLDENDLLPCFQVLGTRDSPLTLNEGRLLELELVLRVSALRESVQRGVIAYTKQSTGIGSDLLDMLPSHRVKELVCRALLPEFMKC